MNKMLRDILFFVICFTLMFNCIPQYLQIGFLSGPMRFHLAFYPVFIGIVYTIYCIFKKKCSLISIDKFTKFIVIYTVFTFVSLVHGLFIYPYYDSILARTVDQVDKITILLGWIQKFGFDMSPKEILRFWMIVGSVKGLLFEILYTFGVSYMIFLWYVDDWKRGFSILIKAILCSCTMIVIYNLVEIRFLAGDICSRNILENINPYIHLIKYNGTWHPPLLWFGQLRSLFAEPSHFGIYIAFVMPFIWYMVIKQKFGKNRLLFYIILSLLMAFFVMLTKARTAFLLYFGELILMICMFSIHRNKYYLKKCFMVIMCSILAFVSGIFFIEHKFNVIKNSVTTVTMSNNKVDTKNSVTTVTMSNNKVDTKNVTNISNAISTYVHSNAISVVKSDVRSNRARYSVMYADFKIGLDHIFFGVGTGLRSSYLPDYFDEKALNNKEVQMWLSLKEKLGIMKFSIARLGEYTARFAETGIVGLLFWMTPVYVLLIKLLKKIFFGNSTNDLKYMMFAVSLIGVIVSAIGDYMNLFFSYWILLGLGYAMCFGKSDEKLDNE